MSFVVKLRAIYILPIFLQKKSNVFLSDQCLAVEINKTISDGGIAVDFSIIKVHTSNQSSNSWGSSNTWGSSKTWGSSNSSCWDHRIVGDHQTPLDLGSSYFHLKWSSNSTRPIRSIRASWKHPGKILQTSREHTLNLLWTYSEPTLNLLWTYSEPTLYLHWT